MVIVSAIVSDTEISRRMQGAYFYDCYALDVQSNTKSAFEMYLATVARAPACVERLMVLRNKLVALVGLKGLGRMAAGDTSKPASEYRVGDRVGIFSLLYLAHDEVILGDSDKHLNVQVSLCRRPHADGERISVTTVVHIHNLLGRIYMFFVGPVHKLIVPAVLGRAGMQLAQ